MSGIKRKAKSVRRKVKVQNLKFLVLSFALFALHFALSHAQEVKQPNVAGEFYPANSVELSVMLDKMLEAAKPQAQEGEIFALIVPHAGYGFSGPTAAYSYKLIKAKTYKTVVVIGTSHYYGFSGASVYPQGVFRTPLGDLEIDSEFAAKILNQDEEIRFEVAAFTKEHSVEVQLPFLQKVLRNFKVVPIVMGDSPLVTCQKLAQLLKAAIGSRKDVLVVASTDMYHGYDDAEAERVDNLTLSFLKNMDAEGLYYSLREQKAQACGGFGVVTTLILAKAQGHQNLVVLSQTNSAKATANNTKGIWTVGYASCVIDGSTTLTINPQASRRIDQEKKRRSSDVE